MSKVALKPCSVCSIQSGKYTCPGCSSISCSLTCSQTHKGQTSCSGVRSKTHYVPIRTMGDANTIPSDYCFLEEGGRLADNAIRDNEDPSALLKLAPGPTISSSIPKVEEEGQERPIVANERQQLVDICKRDRITLRLLPIGMERQRKSRTKVIEIPFKAHKDDEAKGDEEDEVSDPAPDKQSQEPPTKKQRKPTRKNRKTISWTIEWSFPEVQVTKEGVKGHVVLSEMLHGSNLIDGFKKLLDNSDGKSPSASMLAYHLQRLQANGSGTLPSCVDPSLFQFYLRMEEVPANSDKKRELVDENAAVSKILQGSTVIEYPTIYVHFDHSAALPVGPVSALHGDVESLTEQRAP